MKPQFYVGDQVALKKSSLVGKISGVSEDFPSNPLIVEWDNCPNAPIQRFTIDGKFSPNHPEADLEKIG